MSYIALRYANVYGPRQDPYGEAGVVAIFCGNLAAGRLSRINGDGQQTRDYVYVGDVARANILALEQEGPSGVYNIGTRKETNVKELYERLCEVSGRYIPPEYGPAKPGEQLRSSVDPARAEDMLGWYQEIDLKSGLEETFQFFDVLEKGSRSRSRTLPRQSLQQPRTSMA